MEQNEAELIDYLKVIWKRKGLIIGGTLVAAAAALVVSLSMPKTYEVSRTLKIGTLPGSKEVIEDREAVISRLRDHRVIKTAIEKIHTEITAKEMHNLVSIDTKINPDIRYTVQAHDSEVGTQIADRLAQYIIKVHRRIFERGSKIAKEYEAELVVKIRSLKTENREMKKAFKRVIQDQNVDPTAVVLLQANIGERERNLTDIRKELNKARLSRLGSENTSVIAADAPPQHPVKPSVKQNVVLAGTLGLMMFTFIAFFLEYIEKAKGRGK